MSQFSLGVENNNSSTVFKHYASKVWHESESKIHSNYDLSKSMIKNISSAKYSMQNKEEVIILLQAAEIERLTLNLEELTNFKREVERGPMNLKSMEIQVKELTDEIHRNEITIEEIKEKYDAALRNLDEFESSNRQLSRKLADRVSEISRLREDLNERDLTVSQSIKIRDEKEILIKELNDSIYFIAKERDGLESTNQEYENKLALLSQEMLRLRHSNERLKANSDAKDGSLEQLRKQNLTIDQKLQNQLSENQNLNQAIASMQRQIEQFKKTISYLREIHESQESQLVSWNQKMESLQQMNSQKQTEINSLKSKIMEVSQVVHEKETIIKELQSRDQRNKVQTSENLRRVESQFSQLKAQYEKLLEEKRELEYNIQSEKSMFSQEIHNTQSKYERIEFEKETELREVKKENEHLNMELNRLGEILKQINAQTNSFQSEQTRLHEALRSKEAEHQKLLIEIQKVRSNSQRAIREKEQQVESMGSEINRLKQLLERSASQIDIFRQEFHSSQQNTTHIEQELTTRIERTAEENRQLAAQNLHLNQEREDQIKEVIFLKERLTMFEEQIEAISQQSKVKDESLQSINIRYENLLRENEHMSNDLKNLSARLNQRAQQANNKSVQENMKLRQQLKLVSEQNSETKRQNDSLQREVEQLTVYSGGMSNEIKGLSKQIELRYRQIEDKNKELYSKSKQIEDFEFSCNTLKKELEKLNQTTGEQSLRMNADLRSLEQQLHQKDAEIMKSRERIVGLEGQISMLSHELERLTLSIKEKDSLINRKTLSIQDLTKAEQQYKFQIRALKETVGRLRVESQNIKVEGEEFSMLRKQIDVLRAQVSEKDGEIKRYLQKLQNLRELVEEVSSNQGHLLRLIEEQFQSGRNNEQDARTDLKKLLKLFEEFRTHTHKSFESLQNGDDEIKGYLNMINERGHGQIRDFKMSLENLKEDNLTLTDTIRQLQVERDSLKTKISSEQKYDLLLQKFISAEQETSQISSFLQQNAEVQRKQIHTFEQSLSKKQGEIQYLRQQLDSKDTVIRQLRQKNSVIVTQSQQIAMEHQNYKNAYQKELQEIRQSYEGEIQSLKEKMFNAQNRVRLLQQVQVQFSRELQSLKNQNHGLIEQNSTLQNENQQTNRKIELIEKQILQKKAEILEFNRIISENNQEFIRKHEAQTGSLQEKLSLQNQEIQKYLEIISVRDQQIKDYGKAFQKLQHQFNFKVQQLKKHENDSKKYKALQKRLEELQAELSLLMAQRETYIDQNSNPEIAFQSQLQEIVELRKQTHKLNVQNADLQRRLHSSMKKLSQMSEHLQRLQEFEGKSVQNIKKLIDKVSKFEAQDKEKKRYIQEISKLKEEISEKQSQLRQSQIKCRYLEGNSGNNALTLSKYESKNSELVRELTQLEQIISNLQRQNSKLKTENSEIGLELKKASVCQEKLKVLNREINRLSLNNIDLDTELTQYRLQISGDCSLENKCKEQLCLIVMLCAEVQSLRQSLKSSEERSGSALFSRVGKRSGSVSRRSRFD